ncbi:hypothetical protein SB6421_02727 [Klebsiella huaxiensis]|uniref:Uncharacterized protein n=1 Tax=Klebsiella huaxiensis TaxID=2153354 RepID=A0A564PY39_9ENTR|nr:hypothetical protein SB6422_03644 [Klebsiella huaxiensis]VUT23358.1 hypothetical protein SB6421_02727 [Klebsiella huaxiensis]
MLYPFPEAVIQKVKKLLYPSYFKLQMRWLRSLTPVTYWSKLPGM